MLDRRELARLLDAAERDDVWKRKYHGKRERDRLLLALFAYAGLRRSELLGLDWEDVDLERRLLRCAGQRAAGSGSSRSTRRSSRCSSTTCRSAARDPEPALFVGVQGRRLSPDDHDADVPPLRAGRRRHRAQAGHTAHAPARVRLRAACAPAPTCARSRSCSGTSTSTRRSATRASPRTSFGAPSSASTSSAQSRRDTSRPRAEVALASEDRQPCARGAMVGGGNRTRDKVPPDQQAAPTRRV